MTNKLLFIDDHVAIFDSLIDVVKDKLNPVEVTVFSDANKALDHLLSGEIYDLILLDLEMPAAMSGYDFIEELNQHSLYIPTAILSGYINIEQLGKIKELGAVGFISKSSDTERFIQAIRTILAGDYYFSEEIVEEHDATIQAKKTMAAKQLNISSRQLEVLEYLAKGHSNQAIADSLFISLETVKSHIKSLFVALNAKNRIDCAQRALKANLID